MANEWRTLFAFYLEERVVIEERQVQVAEFTSCSAVRFGAPNDEGLHGHPLYGHGLEFYASHEVEGSTWLSDLRRMEGRDEGSGLPNDSRKHFILTFHDSTLEAIADRITDAGQQKTMAGAVAAMTRIILSV